MTINLVSKNTTEKRVLEYLQANASEVLAEKINAGKKTLAGCIDYAKEEARKLADGHSCVCVDDATVFGWVIHYFEEDHITEKAKPGPRLPASAAKTCKPRKAAVVKPAVKPGPAIEQPTMFAALFGEAATS